MYISYYDLGRYSLKHFPISPVETRISFSIPIHQLTISNHLSVAFSVSTGLADVGVGIEKAAKIVGIDFVPLITEQYVANSAILTSLVSFIIPTSVCS